MQVKMECAGGGGSELFTKSGNTTINSSNLSVDTGLGDKLRIFKFTGVATSSYGSAMKFGGYWDSLDPTSCICAAEYGSNGDMELQVNGTNTGGRPLIITNVSNGIVTFKLPTLTNWNTANPNINWQAG